MLPNGVFDRSDGEQFYIAGEPFRLHTAAALKPVAMICRTGLRL